MRILFDEQQWRGLVGHLRGNLATEQAAFAFATFDEQDCTFRVVEVRLLSGDDLAVQTPYHIEVAEHVQAAVIKRAHDLIASLIELHSHVDDPYPRFSWSDWSGFEEFVPHVWFRLKARPYAAIVMGPEGVDALAWVDGSRSPEQVSLVGSEQSGEPCSAASLGNTRRGNEWSA